MKEDPTNESMDGGVVVRPQALLVGVGSAGVHAVSYMRASGEDLPHPVAIDCDGMVLNTCGIPSRVQIGSELTGAMGCGGDPELGKKAALGDYTKLREVFAGHDLAFIVAGLGGGMGTGAAPVIAQLARDEGLMTIVMAVMPFAFEGDARAVIAQDGLKELARTADAVIVFPNEHLLETDDITSRMASAFSKSDVRVGLAIQALWKLLGRSGLINIDFSNVRSVAGQGGIVSLAIAQAGGKTRTRTVINLLMKHPALDSGAALTRARAVLIGVMGGADLTLAEVNEVALRIREHMQTETPVSLGVTIDDQNQERMAVMVLMGAGDETPVKEAPAPRPVAKADKPATSTVMKPVPEQTRLNLEPTGKGRFKDVEPTFYGGEDLDIPTFIRRGIKVLK